MFDQIKKSITEAIEQKSNKNYIKIGVKMSPEIKVAFGPPVLN
jgi:hypothetical protein